MGGFESPFQSWTKEVEGSEINKVAIDMFGKRDGAATGDYRPMKAGEFRRKNQGFLDSDQGKQMLRDMKANDVEFIANMKADAAKKYKKSLQENSVPGKRGKPSEASVARDTAWETHNTKQAEAAWKKKKQDEPEGLFTIRENEAF